MLVYLALIDPVSESTDRAELVTRPGFFLENQTSLEAPRPINQGRQQRAGIPLPKKQKGVAALDRTDPILHLRPLGRRFAPKRTLLQVLEQQV